MSLTLRQRFSLSRFLRGEGPQPGPLLLRQRRVFILPTRQGLLFAGILLLMLIGSINYAASLGFSLTFLLASLALVAMLHTYRNLLHLRVDSGPAEAVFCGEELRVPVTLENPAGQPRFAVSLQFSADSRPAGEPSAKKPADENLPALSCDIPADGGRRVELPLPTQRRGRHPLPRITLATVYPLGLFRAWAYAEFAADVLVYPRPARNAALPKNSVWQTELSGDRGRGADDFVGLRNYHPGDSPRHVHWKTAARGQGLHTKQFGGDRAEELWLDWAALPAGETGVERRLSILARWVLDADGADYRYGLRLPGLTIPLAQGPAQRRRCLEALALFGAGAESGGGRTS